MKLKLNIVGGQLPKADEVKSKSDNPRNDYFQVDGTEFHLVAQPHASYTRVYDVFDALSDI